MTAESRPGIETGVIPEPTMASRLLEDNKSQEAEEKRAAFKEAKLAGTIYVVKRCGDSRAANGLPENITIDIPSIASTGPVVPYGMLLSYQSSRGNIVAVHYDGLAFNPGKMPRGCGGLAAKATQAKEDQEVTGLKKHIKEIPSEDPIITCFSQAEEISRLTDKAVLAVAQDHRTAIFYPLAVFKGREITTNVPLRFLYQDSYDPKKLYEGGIPFLDESYLPEKYQEFMELNRIKATEIHSAYPDFTETTKEQNPGFLIFTSEKTTARERYPKTLAEPSSYFTIHLPRGKYGDYAVIERDAVKSALGQAEYPLTHFSNIHTVLIETPDLYQSRALAKELHKTIDSSGWNVLGKFQVIAVSSVGGRTTNAEVVNK